jgi:2-amino-4-hydroxy-6-hydroxymethyldihydropteridine diphosphokinase
MNSSPASIFISLGSNLGAREQNLRKAIELIGQLRETTLIRESKMYSTAAWGKTDQPDFINMVIEINSSLTPETLMEMLLALEEKMGRIRNDHWGPRLIDMDILFYGGEIQSTLTLTIPHPEVQNRNFVLVPLNELAPAFIHPVLKKNIAQLTEACTDELPVLFATHPGVSK